MSKVSGSIRRESFAIGTVIGFITIGASADVGAAEGASGAHLEEVIVTAERQARSLQKTPVSVGVLSSEDLQESGAKRLWDLNGAIPGLYMSSYPSNMQYVNIRGIGTSDPGVFAAVGYYLDDVYLGRTFGRGSISLPDIERVEVLRGPQGTLYGQNTTGGAIKFVSARPVAGAGGQLGKRLAGELRPGRAASLSERSSRGHGQRKPCVLAS